MNKLLLALLIAASVPFSAHAQSKRGGAVSVIVAPASLREFADKVEALGTTKANETVVITADTTEKVAAIHFEDGQQVKKGDLLLTLDKQAEDAQLRSAQARYPRCRA